MTVNLGQMREMMKKKTDAVLVNVAEEPLVAYDSARNKLSNTLGFIGLGSKYFDDALPEESLIIKLIREGIPKKSLDTLLAKTDLSLAEIAVIIRTSDRTLRRYDSKKILNPEQTERVIELAKLYLRGSEVFGSLLKFNSWMGMINHALGDKRPKEYLDTSIGIRLLMDMLGRIEYGVFA